MHSENQSPLGNAPSSLEGGENAKAHLSLKSEMPGRIAELLYVSPCLGGLNFYPFSELSFLIG